MRQNFKSIATSRTIVLKAAFTFLLFGLPLSGWAQSRADSQNRPAFTTFRHDPGFRDDPRMAAQGHYPGSQYAGTPYALSEPNFTALWDQFRRESEQPGNYQSATYQELVRRQRARAAQEEEIRCRDTWCSELHAEQDLQASPDTPDQSELLKNSKDRDFILRNFRTMYVDARDAKYFGSRQLKAALGKNKDFWKLNVRMVDDPRVADVILKVSYTFAWDFPFELTHRNTTIVLLSGKGEGPFSGPLGAADVARNLVNLTKPWREEKKADGK
jgi:hypothetical protein